MKPSLEQVLAEVYRQEFNVQLVSEWDIGWRITVTSPHMVVQFTERFLDEDFTKMPAWIWRAAQMAGFHTPADWSAE